MATAAVQDLIPVVSTDEAIEQIWQSVFAGEFTTAPAAARAKWHEFRFSRDDLSFLALEGLIRIAEESPHLRRADRSPRPAVGWGSPHGKKKWDQYIGLTWPYQAADGQQKALLDFTQDDLLVFSSGARLREASWRRRAEWGETTFGLLKEHEVSRVRDLPAAALAEVDAAAREAMGRQQ